MSLYMKNTPPGKFAKLSGTPDHPEWVDRFGYKNNMSKAECFYITEDRALLNRIEILEECLDRVLKPSLQCGWLNKESESLT